MMGPHWNPKSDEIAILLQGKGMVEEVCPSMSNDNPGCKNSKFRVEEGDVFVVPKDHPVTQISFNDDSLVFMGFSLKSKKDMPQNIAGKFSILQRLDKNMLAKSFNVGNTTMDRVLSCAQREEIIFECISCAEEVEAGGMEGGEGGRRGGGRQDKERGGYVPRMEEDEQPFQGDRSSS